MSVTYKAGALGAALAATMSISDFAPAEYPAYREPKRGAKANPIKKAKRKAQRRARRISRNRS